MKKSASFACRVILTLSTFSTAHATLLINEIDYDQQGIDTAEFIELYNPGPEPVPLTGYRLDLINGATATIYRSFNLTGYTLAAGGYFVICGNASTVVNCTLDAGIGRNMIQNGSPDGLALFNGSTLIDALSYEGVIPGITEGARGAPADEGSGTLGIGRRAGHRERNDNGADFVPGCITPGAANTTDRGECTATLGTVPQPPIAWLLASGLLGMLAVRKRGGAA